MINPTKLKWALSLAIPFVPVTGFCSRPYQNESNEVVIREATNGRWAAISELGLRKDKASIPLLMQIVNDSSNPESTRMRAEMSLAQMDVEKYFDRLTSGLKSNDPEAKSDAIYRLGAIGTKRAVRELILILDDKGMPPKRKGHVQWPSYAMVAADSLSHALPEVWKGFLDDSKGNGVIPIPAWKAWWSQHKGEFD